MKIIDEKNRTSLAKMHNFLHKHPKRTALISSVFTDFAAAPAKFPALHAALLFQLPDILTEKRQDAVLALDARGDLR